MRPAAFFSIVLVVFFAVHPVPSFAKDDRITGVSQAPFAQVSAALQRAVAAHKLTLVGISDVKKGALPKGPAIKGNQVVMVLRQDLLARLVKADPTAAFEAPMRFHVYENQNGTATVTYVKPSVLLRAYKNPEVRAVGEELDLVFTSVMGLALTPR